MGELSGKRLAQGREAPRLMVAYMCPVCLNKDVLDAYTGPPSCEGSVEFENGKHRPVWMIPEYIDE